MSFRKDEAITFLCQRMWVNTPHFLKPKCGEQVDGRQAAPGMAGLGFGLVSLGGMLGGELVYTLGVNVTHLLYPKPPDEFTDASASVDLPEGHARVVEVGRVPVLLRRHKGKIEAVQAWCPHAGGPLAEGALHGSIVTCPWHGWQFDVTTGRHCLAGQIRQTRYPCRIEGDDVYVDVPTGDA